MMGISKQTLAIELNPAQWDKTNSIVIASDIQKMHRTKSMAQEIKTTSIWNVLVC